MPARIATKSCRIGIAICMLLVVGQGVATGQSNAPQVNGLFGLTPSIRTVVARPPVTFTPLVVTNTTPFVIDATIFVAPARQDAQGGYVPEEDASSRATAAGILEVSPKTAVLNRNSRIEVKLRWKKLPPGTRAAPVIVVVSGKPRRASGEVNTVYRLAAPHLMRLPGSLTHEFKWVSLNAEQGKQRTLLLTGLLKNAGDVFEAPKAIGLTIVDNKHRPVVQMRQKGAMILGAATREFPFVVKKLLPAGNYVATMRTRAANGIESISKPFMLVGPNQLPTSSFDLINPRAKGVIGSNATVEVTLLNNGSKPDKAKLDFSVSRVSQGAASATPVGTKTIISPTLQPGERKIVTTQLGKLEDQQYRALIVATANGRKFDEVTTDFRPTKSEGSSNVPIAIGAIGLLLLLGLLVLLRRRRRRQSPDEAQAAALSEAPAAGIPTAPAGAPASPQVSGKVNINTASIDELQTLKGVGPKAAERIVEHRDEYGAFSSLDELEQISGFSAARVDGLRENATL